MNLDTVNKKLDVVARAVGYQETCPMCEAIAAHRARVAVLVEGTPAQPAGFDVVSVTARSFCAWCGGAGVQEHKIGRDCAEDLRTFWEGINAGRMCAPEVAGAVERLTASLADSFGERAGEYDALCVKLSADMAALPPPRFPYACAVEGCRCEYPKQIAA